MRDKPPPLLPATLIADLACRSGLLLCLDYDGTLAEITPDPASAWPIAGVTRALTTLLRNPRIVIAIISGRPIAEVKRLIEIDSGVFFSGVHGQELEGPTGTREPPVSFNDDAAGLSVARRWLMQHVPPNRGFRVEDKGAAVGLHYRLADEAEGQALHRAFARFIETSTPNLRVLSLKRLVEVVPQRAGKGGALVAIKTRVPPEHVTVYFGDDSTDEEAFAVLEAPDFGVLVGRPRPSAARYRIDSPQTLLGILTSVSDSARAAPSAIPKTI